MHLQKSPTAAELGDLHIRGGAFEGDYSRMAKARRCTQSGSRGSDLSEAYGTACEKRQREGGAKA